MSMTKAGLLAGALAACLAGRAHAQAEMQYECSFQKCVRDIYWQVVGVPAGSASILRQIKAGWWQGGWYILPVDSGGYWLGSEFYYAAPDTQCSTTPYIYSGHLSYANQPVKSIPAPAVAVSSSEVWIPTGPLVAIQIGSESGITNNSGGAPGYHAYCAAYGSSGGPTIYAQKAVLGENTTFYPPLTLE